NIYSCPGGKPLTTTGTLVNDGATILYCASKHDCQACALKSRCCPKSPARRVPRSIYEGARDMARQISEVMGRAHLASIAQEGRDAVRAPQAHSQARQITTTGAERCARRVHPRSNRPEPPKARETDPNADPDSSLSERGKPRLLNKPAIDLKLFSVFFNGIDPKRT